MFYPKITQIKYCVFKFTNCSSFLNSIIVISSLGKEGIVRCACRLKSVSPQSARGRSSIARKPEVHPKLFNSSRKLLRIKVTPDLHLTYSKNGGNLGLILKMRSIACISILLTKHVKYSYLYLFKVVLYIIVAFKAN